MDSNTTFPKWLTPEIITKKRNDIKKCPNPYTEEEINKLELDGDLDVDKMRSYMAIKLFKKYGIPIEE